MSRRATKSTPVRVLTCCALLLAASSLLLPLAATSAAAVPAKVTLRDPKSGLTIVAPRGYRLSARGGVYTLVGGGERARFFFGPSALGAGATGAQLAGALGGRRSAVVQKPTLYSATVAKGAARTYVRVARSGANVQVVLVTRAAGRRLARAATPATVPAVDVAQLVRLVNARTGGVTVPLNTTIPTRKFVAPDGGSSATVPVLDGWVWSGNQGSIEGAHPTQGYIALGEVGGVQDGSYPQLAFSPAFVGPAEVLQTIYPQYVKLISGADVQTTAVQLVPGTEGILGASTQNGIYGAALTINGRPFRGLFVVSSSDAGGLAPTLWYFYYSAIVLPADAPGNLGAALVDTWSSWDASGASRARLAQALQTIASTPTAGAGPIDPAAFQVAADNWNEYIRN
ncbi:MAG: hypothetical protein JWM98_2753 [Thermoleophilia bacterium]|nr:hypothetical protein [Thermoleophilia bacterium]